ncbi:MAG: DUF6160 family protein [bacterium]
MESEEGFTKIHFVVAAVFALTVALGSFAGVAALSSLSDSEMSEVTGQQGIKMDVNLSSSFSFDAFYQDADGPAGTSTGGSIGLISVSPTSTLNVNGVTVDATTGASLGSSGVTGGTSNAIVVGIPTIPSGIKVSTINPGGAGTSLSSGLDGTDNIGAVGIGNFNVTDASIEIGAN